MPAWHVFKTGAVIKKAPLRMHKEPKNQLSAHKSTFTVNSFNLLSFHVLYNGPTRSEDMPDFGKNRETNYAQLLKRLGLTGVSG